MLARSLLACRGFNDFVRKLMDGQVDKSPDRTDFDLGPGLAIVDPGFKLTVPLPKVLECPLFLLLLSLPWMSASKAQNESKRRRAEFSGQGCINALPLHVLQEASVYDYVFDKGKCQWRPWMETVKVADIPETSTFNEIIVQTVDTVRCEGGPWVKPQAGGTRHIAAELTERRKSQACRGKVGWGSACPKSCQKGTKDKLTEEVDCSMDRSV